MMRLKLVGTTLVVLLSALVVACSSDSSPKQAQKSKKGKGQPIVVRETLPAADVEPEGHTPVPADWLEVGRISTYTPDNLREYSGKDSIKLTQAGLEKLVVMRYRYLRRVSAVVEVYAMKEPEGASKLFESEPVPGGQPAAFADAAKLSDTLLTFKKGRYFVRMEAYEKTPKMEEALSVLARIVEGRLV